VVAAAAASAVEGMVVSARSDEIDAERPGVAGAEPKPLMADATSAAAAMASAAELTDRRGLWKRRGGDPAGSPAGDGETGTSSASWTDAASSPQKSAAAQDSVPGLAAGSGVIGTVSSPAPSQVLACPVPSAAVSSSARWADAFPSRGLVSSGGEDAAALSDSDVAPPIGTSSSSASSHWRGRRWTTLLARVEPVLPSE
jgi:hypothetical protein